MTHLPPPPPPPPPGTAATEPTPAGQKPARKGLFVAIIALAVLLLAAAGAAAVAFIPVVGEWAGIRGSGSSSEATAAPATATTNVTETPSTAATPSAAQPSATAEPTFEMAPALTSPPAETAAAQASTPATGRSHLDLGLAIPVDIVPCHGKYLTFYVSSITPGSYATEIQNGLNTYPGSRYLATEGSCSALNQVSRDGTRIYGVYSGPHDTAAIACQARAGVPGSYVKIMNPSTTPESTVACS